MAHRTLSPGGGVRGVALLVSAVCAESVCGRGSFAIEDLFDAVVRSQEEHPQKAAVVGVVAVSGLPVMRPESRGNGASPAMPASLSAVLKLVKSSLTRPKAEGKPYCTAVCFI
jgi:hypothetical protein